MKIVNDFPPNIDKIRIRFDLTGKAPLFCYGDIIYNPHKVTLREDLIVHEEVHSKQQGDDPFSWWEQYLNDNDFRLSQEVEAYATQYNWIKERVKAKTSKQFLDLFAEILSSSLYGSIISIPQARTKINMYLTRDMV